MKIWVAEYGAYEDNYILGVFSSKDKADEALKHYKQKIDQSGYYSYCSNEYDLDEYYNQNLSPLAKALE